MVFRLLENPFVSQKIESRHFFTHACQEKLSPRFLTLREMSPPPPNPRRGCFFRKSFHPLQKGDGERTMDRYFLMIYICLF